jgi:hypothetical protein
MRPASFLRLAFKALVVGRLQLSEIVDEQEMGVELGGGAQPDAQEPGQLRIACAAAPLGDIRWNRC